MSLNVLVIGSGGREHAICWKLSQSTKINKVFAAPGNVGIGKLDKAVNINLDVKNFTDIAAWCRLEGVGLVVVGPEDPLANGIADTLLPAGIKCFGPSASAARIEADKDWAKQFMDRHEIPTARWQGFTSADKAVHFINSVDFPALVVKAAGLAAGKGVVVAENAKEACDAVKECLVDKRFGKAGEIVIVEELLDGPEVSVLGFSDGTTVRAMLPAQDHKRALDGDQGPNTGGMGAYCPCPLLSSQELKWVEKNILQKTVDGLKKEGYPFVGVLYAGLMLTKDGPKVLEFNCRFGDPETEAILPLLQSDLYDVMMSCCNGTLASQEIRWASDESTVAVIMASRGYPLSSSKGDVIKGVDRLADSPDLVVFHCGTAGAATGELVTAGGRVLAVVARSPHLLTAAARATAACATIVFPGAQYRTDIAHKGIPRWILQRGRTTYKSSGVDIDVGDSFVDAIKPAVSASSRAGVMGQIGGFGSLFDIKKTQFKDPILVSGTDGVGTKLKIAQEVGVFSTLGQDLVAMCVNDVLCQGAEPLFFLDYFACGHLEVTTAAQIVKGIADACCKAGCALVGGETAEMPGLYSDGDFDLAGFAVGAVERGHVLPHLDQIKPGDKVLALGSSGVHSNGFSLVRKVMSLQGLGAKDKSPFSNKTLGEELLTPTSLYVKSVLPVVRHVKALAHITGGGITGNLPRVLPPHLAATLDATRWRIPPVFSWLATSGVINEQEMLRTFNCGVGLALVVAAEAVDAVISHLPEATVVGAIHSRAADEPAVVVENFEAALEPSMKHFVGPLVKQLSSRKRIGVLISGSGSNLQSLIDATSGLGSVAMGAEIVLVISNKPGVQGLERAAKAGIPTQVIQHTDYATRSEFDAALHQSLVGAGVEIVCLAGFMRVLTATFVQAWRGRLLNIHPSLLPSFKGTNAQRQALAAGVRVTGCTVHFVEEDIDSGAIIAQKAVNIEAGDTEETLIERVKLTEHKIFPEALKLLATGRIRLDLDTNKIIWQ